MDDKPVQPTSPEEVAALNSIPATYCNKIYATLTPTGMRLTFSELNPASPVPSPRTAVFLGFGEVEALMQLLENQMRLVERVEFSKASDAKP